MFKAYCLYMTQEMAKPRFTIFGGIAITLAIAIALVCLCIVLHSPMPYVIFMGLVTLVVVIPAMIGAFIRDRRLRHE